MTSDMTFSRRTALGMLGLLGFAAMTIGGARVLAQGHAGWSGVVYTLSNEVDGNNLVVFHRTPRGTLIPAGTVPTGGLGTGASLHNQGALATDPDGLYLFGVNAGSDTISVFDISGRWPELVQVIPSGGHIPNSIAVHEKLVYVLHTGGDAGGVDSLVGFQMTDQGLAPLKGSSRPLSSPTAAPAQVSFTADGSLLIVTERATNKITTYKVNGRGIAGAPNPQNSVGQTPFGFRFTAEGRLVVTEAFGGAPGASTVSLYDIAADGTLTPRVSSLPTKQTAACWVVLTDNMKWAYTSNTNAGTVTGMNLDDDTASLSLINPSTGQTASLGLDYLPTDSAVVGNSLLYVLGRGVGRIAIFDIKKDGSLAPLELAFGFPTQATGLLVR